MRTAITALASSIIAGLAGCSSGSGHDLKPRTVTLADFAPAAPATAPTSQPVATAAATPAPQAVAQTPAKPAAASPDPIGIGEQLSKPGDEIIVDSVIGQVSGRPIFADQFLEPISDQLRRESEKSSPRDFLISARAIINAQLNQTVLNELLIAEGENALTEQQQQGLLAFIRTFREKSIAEALGSVTERESQLKQEGSTLDESVDAERKMRVIQNLLNEKVQPRVIVAWRDVEREYEKRKAEFNPPASVTLGRIRLSNKDQAALIDDVKARLDRGDSFEGVCALVGTENTSIIGPLQIPPEGMGAIAVNEAYKPALQGLTLGQTTKPIVVQGTGTQGTNTIWLHVNTIDQPPVLTLYDVQRRLSQELYARRTAEERDRYIRTLFEKGIYDQLNEMSNRLLAVALLRYGKG